MTRQGRAREEVGPTEEGRGGEAPQGGGREEGQGGRREEETFGRGREEEAGNDAGTEGKAGSCRTGIKGRRIEVRSRRKF